VAVALTALAVLVAAVPATLAQEEEKDTAWKDSAELSWVATSGNSETNTFGFRNLLKKQWARSMFSVDLGGLRASSTSITRVPVAPDTDNPDDYYVREDEEKSTTAENYYFKTRYGRDISDRFFWYVGANWERNQFAGFDNRYVLEAGVGNTWFDVEDRTFRTAYALTYTKQEDVFEMPDAEDSFAGFRVSWDYINKFGKVTEYVNTFVFDFNFDESSAWRGDMFNGLSVAMSEKLALKVGLRWQYQNEPPYELAGLVDEDGVPVTDPDDPEEQQIMVPVQLENLDTTFTTSLVINF